MSAGPSILVVDDQPEILSLAEAILQGDGFRVVTASSGDRALEQVFREPFDLVLLDINMPGMDGWEMLRLMSADPALSSIPVVMFSVKGEIRNKVQGMQLGAVDYITKPFSMDELLGRVRKVLDDVKR